jgi:hypothetical protein
MFELVVDILRNFDMLKISWKWFKFEVLTCFDMFWLRLASLWPGPALPCRRNRWDDQRPQLVLIHHIHLAPCMVPDIVVFSEFPDQIIPVSQSSQSGTFSGIQANWCFRYYGKVNSLWQTTHNISHWVTPKPPLSPTDGNDFCYGYDVPNLLQHRVTTPIANRFKLKASTCPTINIAPWRC